MRIVLFRLTCVALMLLPFAAIGCEEPTDPSLQPPEIETPDVTSAPTAPSQQPSPTTPDLASRSPADIRRLAEGGDVAAMMLLGRSYESLGQTKQARSWYQKAADAGSDDGKQALAKLDAPPPVPATTTAPTAVAATTGRADDRPAAPTAKRIPIPPPPPGEPGKLRWVDIMALLNYDDMVSDGRVVPVDPRRAPPGSNQKTQFVGVTSARDGGITVAATGPSENDLLEVTAVIRVRNKLDPGSSSRVGQAGSVTALVTSDNVSHREIVEWVTRYLQTEQRSEPIFRAGWRISVSGSVAEGRPDAKPHLGTAVMIEMKK